VVERFFNEARASSIVDHPGIVEIFDCGIEDERAYLIMEYLVRVTYPQMICTRISRGFPNAP
jgi:eukaryotic-like serine/threonine-protein kinase